MKTLFKNFMNWIQPKKNLSQESAAMTVHLLHSLAMTQEEEFSCDDVHALLDEFVELKLRGENVEELMPLVKHHLDMCRDCFQEYEALMAALEFEKTI